MKRLRKFLKNQRGQGMLEYVLLLGIIAVLVLSFKTQLTTMFNQATGNLNSSAQDVFNNGGGGH